MGAIKFHGVFFWGVLILAAGLLAACADETGTSNFPGQETHTFPVDALFKEFYQTLGGQQVLGPAISGLEMRDALQCQFTERALLCFNPAVTDETRFSLYPLGRELGIREELHLSAASLEQDSRVVDGFTIYDKFLPMYDQLFGARYVGRPLTELRINQDLQRAEQFFENVGFYQDLGDPNGSVHLIPYGAYLCGGACSYKLNEYWSIVKANTAEQPFAASVARLGGPAVFGSILLKPQIVEDGSLQQVYTNGVLYAPPDDLSQVRLRPLPRILGYEVQALVERKIHDQLVFYKVQGELGHNVPKQFDDFIAEHGGRELSGDPISEVILLPGKNIYQQCFENYCLNYDPSASNLLKVRMAPLGEEYLKRFPQPETAQIRNLFGADKISLTVAADKPNLSDNEPQVVRLAVTQKESGQPLERVEASLVLSFQDRPSVRYFTPPTDAQGVSIITLPPQPNLANGSRVALQVCLNLPSDKPICAQDSYLIWNVQQ